MAFSSFILWAYLQGRLGGEGQGKQVAPSRIHDRVSNLVLSNLGLTFDQGQGGNFGSNSITSRKRG